MNGSLAKDVLRPFTLERSARPLGAFVCRGGRKAGAGVVLVPATVFVVVLGVLEVVLPAKGAALVVADVIVLVVVLVDVLVVLSVVPVVPVVPWQ